MADNPKLSVTAIHGGEMRRMPKSVAVTLDGYVCDCGERLALFSDETGDWLRKHSRCHEEYTTAE